MRGCIFLFEELRARNCIPKYRSTAVRDAIESAGRALFEADCIPKYRKPTVRDANEEVSSLFETIPY